MPPLSQTTMRRSTSSDLRRAVGERRPDRLDLADTEYYQLWASRHGFMPNLSILDLLCNTGREAVFTLLDMAKHT